MEWYYANFGKVLLGIVIVMVLTAVLTYKHIENRPDDIPVNAACYTSEETVCK